MTHSYSRDLSVKIRSAKREKALRGELVTRNCIYGYMLDGDRNMVADPEAAETVRIIFEMYSAKKSLADIERRLYEEKRLSPSAWKKIRRGEPVEDNFRYVWKKAWMLGILRDEQYLGVYIAGKTKVTAVGSRRQVVKDEEEWIRIPDHHPAIISWELFDVAQKQLQTKGEPLRKRELGTTKRYAAFTDSPLNGKVVCGHCGHVMIISCTKNAAFHCHFTLSAPDAGCHKLRILKSELESVVLEAVRRQAKVVRDAGLRADDIRRVSNPKAADYLNRIENLRSEKRRLYEALVTGSITAEEYKSKKAESDAELEKSLKVYAVILSETKKSLPDEDSIQAAVAALEAQTLTDDLASLLIEKVLVFPGDKIEIVWKLSGFLNCVQHETEFVSLAEHNQ